VHLAVNVLYINQLNMRRVLLAVVIFFLPVGLLAQIISPRKRDSLIALLPKTTDLTVKVELLQNLALTSMGDSMSKADYYGNEQIMIAEESREPWLIITAYLNNAARYRYVSGNTGNSVKSVGFAKRALTYAESVKNYDGMGLAYVALAAANRSQMNQQQALDYNNKAIALMPDLNRDTVKVSAYQSLGNTYASRNEKLPALKSYLNALEVAEKSGKEVLIADCYETLASFYSDVQQYDQAREYTFKMLGIYRKKNDVPSVIQTYNKIAGIFQAEKQYDLAQQYYEKAYKIADSINSEGLKFLYNVNILNLYFSSNQMAKGGAYFESHPEIASYVKSIGQGYQVDMVKAVVLTQLKRYDSALLYFKKAEPVVEVNAPPLNRYSFYSGFAGYYAELKNWPKSLEYMLKANALAEKSNNLEMLRDVSKELDTIYFKAGNLQQSAVFKSKYYQYKDSLTSLGKEKDLVGLQVEDERKRQERIAKEKEAKMERRNNIQLMGLFIGIFSFLCLLLMLGRFKVSETLIKILSFIALIFVFEFVILIADRQIHEWTHGEPLKVILIKVFIAGVLLPLHHVLEHKMIHYLTTRNKLKLDAGKWAGKFKSKKITMDSPHF
jgi:tetratricopeptide (TPR) repeat protein